jgi:glutamine phosphoribosylpyrophosphate amidotransferase
VGCGIFGIFKHSGNAPVEIYEGLLMLQHRGQDSAGIVSYDGERFRERKVSSPVRVGARPVRARAPRMTRHAPAHRTTAW